jgi:hypothetical protein
MTTVSLRKWSLTRHLVMAAAFAAPKCEGSGRSLVAVGVGEPEKKLRRHKKSRNEINLRLREKQFLAFILPDLSLDPDLQSGGARHPRRAGSP